MEVRVRHGTGTVTLRLPPAVAVSVLAPPPTPPSPDPRETVGRALDAPVGGRALREAARGVRRVAVVVSDGTRPSATARWLPLVLDRLHEAGVPAEATAVVVARGIHERPSPAEVEALVGRESLGRARVVTSEPDDAERNADLERDPVLGAVRVHRDVAESDLIVLTGAVAPHYLAGWSGGPKALVPGVADRATVAAAHRLTLDATVAPDGSVRSVAGRWKGNSFREALLRVARATGRSLCLDVVVSDDGGVAFAAAGEVGAAQAACAAEHERLRAVPRPEAADLVIAGGGHPRDSDLVQAHKGLVAAVEVAKPGAPIVWFARAERGAGHPRFLPWFETGPLPRHLGALRRDFHPYGLTAYALRWKAARHPVHVVSDVSADVLRAMGLLPFPDGESALAYALSRHEVRTCVVLPSAADACFA